eukprot:7390717-Prymnesium_polylepis.1
MGRAGCSRLRWTRHTSSRAGAQVSARNTACWARYAQCYVSAAQTRVRSVVRNAPPAKMILDSCSRCGAEGVPFLALTATASPEVRSDIETVLELRQPLRSVESVYRNNLWLSLELRPPTSKAVEARVLELLLLHGVPAIVYATSVAQLERLYARLGDAAELQGAVGRYHSGGQEGKTQPEQEQCRVLEGFMAGTLTVVVATCAFGLGVNKRGIRQVIHVDPPHDLLDGQCQEDGRAGRGDAPARCTLLASSRTLTANDRSDAVHAKCEQMRAYINTDRCLWAFFMKAFGESIPWTRNWRCHHCDNCAAADAADAGGRVLTTQVECAPMVRVLLGALSQAQQEAILNAYIAWEAIKVKMHENGSRLKELKGALPRTWRSSVALRDLLAEVLVPHTSLFERSTCVSNHPKASPHDGFRLTEEGRRTLVALEQAEAQQPPPPPPPLLLPLPLWLQPRYAGRSCNDEGGRGGEASGSEEEDDDAAKRAHAGYASAAERPGTPVAVDARVAIYFTAPDDGWFEGQVVSLSSCGRGERKQAAIRPP